MTVPRPGLASVALAGLLPGLIGCVEPAPAPVDGRAVDDPLDAEVVAVLEARCVSCHGVDEAEWAVLPDPAALTPHRYVVDDHGRLATADQRRLAREVLLGHVDPRAPPLGSPLARAPLATSYSGLPHPEVFDGPRHPDLEILLGWIEAETATARAGIPATVAPGPAARAFAEEVVPVLLRKGCFGANCHGPRAFNDLRLDPGVPALPERFTPAIHARNRRAMLGANTRLVHLAGDVERSRQLVKSVPIETGGGVFHRGGNRFLDRGDPDHEVLVRWLELEAAELTADVGVALGLEKGLVFVRRPRHSPQRFFEDDTFQPGARLLLRHPDGAEVDLTDALPFDGPVDVRAPEVSYDARLVVVPVRPSADAGFDLWEVDLARRAARRLTFSPAADVHFLDPLWVPGARDPGGRDLSAVDLVFVSNRAGGVSPSSPQRADGSPQRRSPRYDAWRMGHAAPGAERSTFEAARRLTWTVHHVRRPTMRSNGEILFTALREGWQAGARFFHGALFRTHIDGSEFHTHHGNRSAVPLLTDDRELPSGLEVRIGRDADSWWGGALLIADHQLGPRFEPGGLDEVRAGAGAEEIAGASLPQYAPSWLSLDPTARVGGLSSGGAWRDPAPLPDGSLLAAWAPGPVDLSDPDADPDFDIVRVTPAPAWQAPDGLSAGPIERTVVVSGPLAELYPRPLHARPKESVRLGPVRSP